MTPLVALSVGWMGALAAAQQAGAPEGFVFRESGVVPIDQAVEDYNPLSASLRQVDGGLGISGAFDRVFRLPGKNGRLMRVQGGLYAIFDESVYTEGEQGLSVEVPSNTMFWIGPPPDLLGGGAAIGAPQRLYQNRVNSLVTPVLATSMIGVFRPDASDTDAEQSKGPQTVTGFAWPDSVMDPATPQPPEGRIVWDDHYREDRLRSLMHDAARAAGGLQSR